jgi:hypothetical protein
MPRKWQSRALTWQFSWKRPDDWSSPPVCSYRTEGAFRISYDPLDGRYLRQNPFLELIRAGYIGAHAETTADLTRLVDEILKDDRAVIAAIHSFADRAL